jgi:hypothetical protein
MVPLAKSSVKETTPGNNTSAGNDTSKQLTVIPAKAGIHLVLD